MLEHALGLGVDDADEHGHAMIDDTDRLADDLIAALVGGKDDLAGRAEEEQAVDACLNHAVDVALKGSDVELAVLGVGNDDRRDDATVDLICHEGISLCSLPEPRPGTFK